MVGKELSMTRDICAYRIHGTPIEVVDTPGITEFEKKLKQFQKVVVQGVEISWKSFSKQFVCGVLGEKPPTRPDVLILVLDATKSYEVKQLSFYVQTLRSICMYPPVTHASSCTN